MLVRMTSSIPGRRIDIGSTSHAIPLQASGGVESLRAIPWIFAWTQNRLVLPAWLGVGDALVEAFQQVISCKFRGLT